MKLAQPLEALKLVGSRTGWSGREAVNLADFYKLFWSVWRQAKQAEFGGMRDTVYM